MAQMEIAKAEGSNTTAFTAAGVFRAAVRKTPLC